jgi:hypothetical protein
MVTTKVICLEQIIRIWDDGLQTHFNSIRQNVKLSANERNLVEDTTMYRRVVGSLIYMTITRPNLSYDVGAVSQFMQTP